VTETSRVATRALPAKHKKTAKAVIKHIQKKTVSILAKGQHHSKTHQLFLTHKSQQIIRICQKMFKRPTSYGRYCAQGPQNSNNAKNGNVSSIWIERQKTIIKTQNIS
jgi:hypothetical protein